MIDTKTITKLLCHSVLEEVEPVIRRTIEAKVDELASVINQAIADYAEGMEPGGNVVSIAPVAVEEQPRPVPASLTQHVEELRAKSAAEANKVAAYLKRRKRNVELQDIVERVKSVNWGVNPNSKIKRLMEIDTRIVRIRKGLYAYVEAQAELA